MSEEAHDRSVGLPSLCSTLTHALRMIRLRYYAKQDFAENDWRQQAREGRRQGR